jgi:RHS repeat-associated protein
LLVRYLHGDAFGQPFARVDLRAANASERVLWYLTDHLNSVRLVLDESGDILDQIAYDAFGNIVAQLNPTTGVVGSLFDNPILFTSRKFDAETGLYYHRARYLDPTAEPLDHARPAGLRRRRRQPVSVCGQHADAAGRSEWLLRTTALVGPVGPFLGRRVRRQPPCAMTNSLVASGGRDDGRRRKRRLPEIRVFLWLDAKGH